MLIKTVLVGVDDLDDRHIWRIAYDELSMAHQCNRTSVTLAVLSHHLSRKCTMRPFLEVKQQHFSTTDG